MAATSLPRPWMRGSDAARDPVSFPGAATDIFSLVLSPAAVSGFVAPKVSESCPPGLAFSAGLLLVSLMMALNLSLLDWED